MDGYSIDESECSVPEFLTIEQLDDFNNGDLIDRGVGIEQSSVDWPFLEMNRQISDPLSQVADVVKKNAD